MLEFLFKYFLNQQLNFLIFHDVLCDITASKYHQTGIIFNPSLSL